MAQGDGLYIRRRIREATPLITIILALGLCGGSSTIAYSNATSWLAAQQVAAGCGEENGGRFKAAGLIERDLTGDGRKDLVISHEGLSCDNRGASLMCGQLCTVLIYVREGDLLVKKAEYLGRKVRVDNSKPPAIFMLSLNSGHTLRWNGSGFD